MPRFTIVRVRENCYRVEGPHGWGIVEFNGSEWLACRATYQRKGVKNPHSTHNRRPRYRRVGFYPAQKEAMDALKAVLAR